MIESNKMNSTRRSFFVRGSAAVGAGLVSASALASPLVFDGTSPLKNQMSVLQSALNSMEDREAIRQLQLAYTALLENHAYNEVAEMFSADAEIMLEGVSYKGKQIGQLFQESYGEQGEAVYTAFRQNASQQKDSIEISEDGRHAKALFHCQVEVSIPMEEDSVLGEMARLQGQYASSRWVDGSFEMAYRREAESWRISRLSFSS